MLLNSFVFLLFLYSALSLNVTVSKYNKHVEHSKNKFETYVDWSKIAELFGSDEYNFVSFVHDKTTSNPIMKIQDASSLEYIWMEDNGLTHVPLFEKLPNVLEINLGKNQIEQVNSYVFSSIPVKTIYLNNNRIEIIDYGSFGDDVEFVHLDCNKLEEFIKDWFKNPEGLKKLSLGGNEIKAVGSNDFDGFHNLEALLLAFNKIKRIEPFAFGFRNRFRTLRINYNELEELNYDVFNNGSVKYFFINNNRLRYLSDEFSSVVGDILFVSGNPWLCSCVERIKKWRCDTRWRTDKCEKMEDQICEPNRKGSVIKVKDTGYNREKFCEHLKHKQLVPSQN